MKKIICLVVLGLSLAPVVRAETLFGFLDGNLYNSTGEHKGFCIMDGCYTLDGQLINRIDPVPVPTIIPVADNSETIKSFCINPVYQWRSEQSVAEQTYLSSVAALDHVNPSFIGRSAQLQAAWQITNQQLNSQINRRVLDCIYLYNYHW